MPTNTTYFTSLLGQSVAFLIDKLNEIKQKYPKLKGIDPSAEQLQALKLLTILEEVLKKLHYNVLPRFDNQKKLTTTELLPIGLDLYQLKNLQKEFNKQLTIAHPIAFEVAVLLLSLLEKTPPSIKELIPFFNPEAGAMDFSSGATSLAVKMATGSKYKVILKDRETFTYELTTYKGDVTTRKEIPGQSKYTESRELYSTKLLQKMNAYLSNNLSTPIVQNHLARVKILQKFIDVELELITTMVATHVREIQEEDSLLSIDALSQSIQKNQSLLQNNKSVIAQLQGMSKQYATEKLDRLLESHPLLKPQLEPHDFSAQVLPEMMAGSDGAIPIKKALQQHIKNQITLLETTKEQLQEKIETQIKQWQQQSIETYSATIQGLEALIHTFQDTLTQITSPDDQAPLEKDKDAIKQRIERKKEALDALAQLNEVVKIRMDEIKANAVLSLELTALDKDNVVQNAQTQQSEAILQDLLTLKQQIKTSSTGLEKTIHELESHIEKTESEAAFLESLELANPEQMQEALRLLEEQLSEANTRHETTMIEHVQILDSIAETHLQTQQIEGENRLLIESLSATAEKLGLLSSPPNIDVLIKSSPLTAEFIQSIMESLTQSLVGYPGAEQLRQDHQTLFDIFRGVEKILMESPQEIPFKKINALPILKRLNPPPNITRLNYLLTIIGLEPNPTYELLNTRIKSAQVGLHERIQREPILQLITDLQQSIPARQQELNTNFDRQQSIEETANLIGLQQQKEEKEHSLTDINQEKTLLEQDSLALKTTLKLIGEIQAYHQRIQEFTDTHEFSLEDASLYEHLIELQGQYKQLDVAIKALSGEIEQGTVSENYIEILSNLGKAAHERLTSAIKLKIDFEPLRVITSRYNDELTDIFSQVETASPQLINTLIERYKKIHVDIAQQDTVLKQLKINVAKIEDELKPQRIKTLSDLQASMKASMIGTGNLLMDKLIAVFTDLESNAQVFAKNELQERIENHNKSVQKLADTEQSFTVLSMDYALDDTDLAFLSLKLTTLKSLKETVAKQLKQSHAATSKLLGRIEERRRVVEQFKKQDLEDDLKTELDAYADSGDSAGVLKYLLKQSIQSSSIKRSSLLNTMTAELMDLDQKVPTNYQDEIQEIETDKVRLQRVQAILNHYRVDSHKSSYPQAIDDLYQLINKMANTWKQTTPLTIKLTHTLSSFVLKHPEKLPTRDDFNQFKKHFTARLHSQDNLMSKHRSAWKGHLANFFIGLFTLGIALGIKAIYSSIKEGKSTLFFTETKRKKYLSTIDEHAKTIDEDANSSKSNKK